MLFTLLLFFHQTQTAPHKSSDIDFAEGNASLNKVSINQAIASAINQLQKTNDGYRLNHPQYRAEFTSAGLQVTASGGGPAWQWQLNGIYTGSHSLNNDSPRSIKPTNIDEHKIVYQREGLQEAYLLKSGSIEQRFIIPEPLKLNGEDLVIEGSVKASGRFIEKVSGWAWKNDRGQINLGDVTVFDANGELLAANMQVTANHTLISVDAQALSQAAYPVTIDPEISAGNFRISHMGLPEADNIADAYNPSIAYNSVNHEYFVCWYADNNSGPLVNGEFEIFAQRIDAATGCRIGGDIRISFMGPDGQNYSAVNPEIAFNSINNQYLVVWSGDDNSGSLVDNEFEIFGQLIDGATTVLIGSNFRISDMGPDGNINYAASVPDVAYNSVNNQYLVTWHGDDNSGLLVNDELEIFGQRIEAQTGAEIGTDFRISSLGTDGDENYDAIFVTIEFNHLQNEYLVAWNSDNSSGLLADNEYEVYVQRIDGATGNAINSNIRISNMGPIGDSNYDGSTPAIAYNNDDDQYLVTWHGDDTSGTLVNDEFEIFAIRLNSDASAIGNQFRISYMGPDGDAKYDAFAADVVYNPTNREYLVVWGSDDNTAGIVDDEREIFGIRINASTGTLIDTHFRISDMGPDGDTNYDAYNTQVVYNTSDQRYFTAWDGDDNTRLLINGEQEIFGRQIDATSSALIGRDLRISHAGPGDTKSDAYGSDIAYNSINQEYLVCWYADDSTTTLVDEEYEIYGQRINAITGEMVGDFFRISFMGSDGDPTNSGFNPAITYNSTNNQYMVVWQGRASNFGLVFPEQEIFGQRIDGNSGSLIGGNFQISFMGSAGQATFSGLDPAIAYNQVDNQYMVVWRGDDDSGNLTSLEFEVYGQRLAGATGALIDGNIRISFMGTDGDASLDASYPAISYNSTNNQFLVVWEGDDNIGALVNEEFEIYGQPLDAVNGALISSNFRISFMGPDGNADFDALRPDVAYNSADNQYLVTWTGDDNTAPLIDNDYEVFGQRLDALTMAPIDNHSRISFMNAGGGENFDAFEQTLSYNSTMNQYLVVWYGDRNTGANNAFEIYSQRLDALTMARIDTNFRISFMGPDSDPAYDASFPVAAHAPQNNRYLVVWWGDSNDSTLVDGEYEIFGQFLEGDPATAVEPNPGTGTIADGFRLSQNYPNPFNPTTTIKFELPVASVVTLDIHDILGQHVVGAFRETPLRAGAHVYHWDATDATGNPVASGMYFYRLKAGNFVQTRKMMLLR